MQGSPKLSKGKTTLLLFICLGAIAVMLTAPQGSVSFMFAKIASEQAGDSALHWSSPKPLPELSFTDAEGKSQPLSIYKGKVVLLNFWALWCQPCKVEKPKLNQLQADYESQGLVVLSLADSVNTPAAMQQYFTQHGLTHLKPANDPGSAAFRALGLRGVPSTIVINKQGQEVARAEGMVDWNTPALRQKIESYIKE